MSSEELLEAAAAERQRILRRAIPFLLIAGLGFLTTWGCFTAPLLNLDDGYLVPGNPMVTGDWPWWECFRRVWFHQYVPLTFLSYRLNAEIFGLDAAWGYRLVNWLIHCSSAIVLWRLGSMLGWGRKGGLFVALFWVVHPLACETVAWISERSNALCFLFGSLGFLAYVKWHGQWRGVAMGTLGLAAALLSKPVALGWFPIFVVLEVVGGPRRLAESPAGAPAPATGERARYAAQAAVRLVPPALLTIVFLWVGIGSYENATRPAPGGSWFAASLTATGLFLRYVWNILVPIDLSAMYATHAIVALTDVRLWGNLVIWVLLIAGSLKLASSRRRAVFAWLWFLGGLGPASNLIPIGYPMQDRYVYISSAGLLWVVVEVAMGVAARAKKGKWISAFRLRNYGLFLGISYVSFLGLLAILRAPLWADSYLLMEHAVEVQPDGFLSHFHYAIQVEQRARAIEEGPGKDPAVAAELRRIAVEHLRTAAVQRDSYIGYSIYLHVRLARDLSLLGKRDEAVRVLAECQSNLDALLAERLAGRPACVPTEPGCPPHVLKDIDLTDMLICMGETYLAFAANTSGAEAQRLCDVALFNARAAMQFKAMPVEKCELLARMFLFLEATRDGSVSSSGVARGRMAVAAEQFVEMRKDRQILPLMECPVSSSRVQVLACIAMARAGLRTVERGEATGAAEAILQSSVDWVRRAVAIEPTLGESHWTLANVLKLILHRLPPDAHAEAAKVRAERIEALAAIPPDSPRHRQAVAILETERRF